MEIKAGGNTRIYTKVCWRWKQLNSIRETDKTNPKRDDFGPGIQRKTRRSVQATTASWRGEPRVQEAKTSPGRLEILPRFPTDGVIRYPDSRNASAAPAGEQRGSWLQELQQKPPPRFFRGGTSSSQRTAHFCPCGHTRPCPSWRKRNFSDVREIAGWGGGPSLWLPAPPAGGGGVRAASSALTFLGGLIEDSIIIIIKTSQGNILFIYKMTSLKVLELFKQALIISTQISDGLRKIHFGKRHF